MFGVQGLGFRVQSSGFRGLLLQCLDMHKFHNRLGKSLLRILMVLL